MFGNNPLGVGIPAGGSLPILLDIAMPGLDGIGVEVDGGVIEADAVVIAMGPWSILAARWLPLPAVFGYKGHSLVFDSGEAAGQLDGEAADAAGSRGERDDHDRCGAGSREPVARAGGEGVGTRVSSKLLKEIVIVAKQ